MAFLGFSSPDYGHRGSPAYITIADFTCLGSFKRAKERRQSIVNAVLLPTPRFPTCACLSPSNTEVSVSDLGHLDMTDDLLQKKNNICLVCVCTCSIKLKSRGQRAICGGHFFSSPMDPRDKTWVLRTWQQTFTCRDISGPHRCC